MIVVLVLKKTLLMLIFFIGFAGSKFSLFTHRPLNNSTESVS